MGSMAGCAPRICHRIIHMSAFERRSVCFVALYTEIRHSCFEEKIGFFGSVGIMAADAASFNRTVFELSFLYPFAEFTVAGEAEFVPRRQQIILVVRAMGVMTEHALAFTGDLMDTPGLPGNQGPVALETDLVRVRIEEFPV